jgi:hypothetical protein
MEVSCLWEGERERERVAQFTKFIRTTISLGFQMFMLIQGEREILHKNKPLVHAIQGKQPDMVCSPRLHFF